jgi:hypothetical protein
MISKTCAAGTRTRDTTLLGVCARGRPWSSVTCRVGPVVATKSSTKDSRVCQMLTKSA